jgi:comEA protein
MSNEKDLNENKPSEDKPSGISKQSFAEKLILFSVFLIFAAIVVAFAYNWNYIDDDDLSDDVTSFQYTTYKKEKAVSESSNGGIIGKININIATVEELDALPGIGPSKAQAIVDYREKESIFTKPEDIKNVSGIGDKTYEQIKDYITVG